MEKTSSAADQISGPLFNQGHSLMARIFVVNADDLGVSRGATLGIVQAHLDGVVTSASLSPTGADYIHAVETVNRRCPELGIGLHFTLSAGKPISASANVPLLIDQDGYFRWEFVSLLKTLKFRQNGELLDQIEIELEAQLLKLLEDGVTPDHIDSERHVHLIPGIFERVVRAANRHRIPFVRAGNDMSLTCIRLQHFSPLFLHGGILKFMLLQSLRRRSLALLDHSGRGQVRFCDNFASYLYTGRLDLVLQQVLAKAPAGITEIMVHPGIPEESRNVALGNPGLEHYLVQMDRKLELEACIEARKFPQHLQIKNFRSLAKEPDGS
ncbi:carbohydrate deacetylase [Pseudomonadota bacterium]